MLLHGRKSSCGVRTSSGLHKNGMNATTERFGEDDAIIHGSSRGLDTSHNPWHHATLALVRPKCANR